MLAPFSFGGTGAPTSPKGHTGRFSGSDFGTSRAGIQVTGTFTATLKVQGSNDGGTTWVDLELLPWGGPGTPATSITAAGGWWVVTSGIGIVKVTCSAYSSGTPVVYVLPVVE